MKTLNNVMIESDFDSMILEKSSSEGQLFLTASSFSMKQNKKVLLSKNDINYGFDLAKKYQYKANVISGKLRNYLAGRNKPNENIVFYVPSRALNILYTINFCLKKCRFVDDDEIVYGKYYPGFNVKIENLQNLIDSPSETVIVFSNTFGNIIIKKLLVSLPSSTTIISWNELFE